MKVLLVSHNYPPDSTAGTETYTATLAAELLRRGRDVRVFTTAKDISRPQLSTRDRSWNGVPVREVTNNLFYRSFRETWDHPAIEAPFQELYDELRPDVVHFQHLLYLSAGCLARAHERSAVLFTLHDYWLQCPRFGHRVHADGAVCHTIDHARCGTCLASFKYAQSPVERTLGGVIAGVRRATGLDLGRLARGTKARLARPGTRRDAEVEDDRAHELEGEARERGDELRRAVLANVDLVLTTSRFLRARMVGELGLPEARVEHVPIGVDRGALAPATRDASEKLRVAFFGTLTPLKGAHVLLEAWARLPAELRARAELVVFGPSRYDPAYQARLAELAHGAGARLGGQLARAEVAQELARTDLVVVPSLWYENSPLVILEALAAGVPLLVSDQGGMAELVEKGRTGAHFAMGDVAGLARELEALCGDRAALERLRDGARASALPTVAEHVDAIEARYVALAARRGARG